MRRSVLSKYDRKSAVDWSTFKLFSLLDVEGHPLHNIAYEHLKKFLFKMKKQIEKEKQKEKERKERESRGEPEPKRRWDEWSSDSSEGF